MMLKAYASRDNHNLQVNTAPLYDSPEPVLPEVPCSVAIATERILPLKKERSETLAAKLSPQLLKSEMLEKLPSTL